MNIIITLIATYILGSIPTSYIMGKLIKGIDIRDFGSGNVGATNALRILGTKIGVFTLIIDIGKGFLAVNIARIIIPEPTDLIIITTGLFAIIGHIFTIFLKYSFSPIGSTHRHSRCTPNRNPYSGNISTLFGVQ
jgi:glycerol-3-phosphate acyltransferase PlsY